ncbi:juvenile hormone esterase-like [Zeugodacus cucurbitae]|uniref:juvenile hormone esterase-like n=1 Tax=Zeugodacus cucurbitae TaxID=28588 RepID=UPI0023D8EA4A|nr:juvenile hormone esterase-like [Zeugodacus cucurbitae]
MKGIILWLTCLVVCTNLDSIQANLTKVCFDGLSCVHGRYMSGYDSYTFEAFLGIPYAKPPIGNLRFSNPEVAALWNGTLSTLYPKPDCIQREYSTSSKTISGSEDCLYLNIYRPVQRAGGKLPVMFYIHGGGLFSGTPSPVNVGPQYFMAMNDVILIVPAYRLGPFGFLSTNDTEMMGNYGLKDQNLALKWVNKYISAFDGDPNSVTIFGHSAGAVSVHLHLMNIDKKASPLFHNAVMMSGVANSPFHEPLSDPKGQVVKLAKAAGVNEAEYLSSASLVQALRSIKAETLLQAVDSLKVWDVHPYITFRPNIENDDWSGAYVTNGQYLYDGKIPYGTAHDVSWIVGNAPAKGEGLVVALHLASDTKLQEDFNSNFNETLSLLLDLSTECNQEIIIDLLVTEYMDGRYELNNYTLNGFLELLGDAHFIYPTYTLLKNNVNSTRDDFKGIIHFNYRGPYSYSTALSNSSKNFGPAHADDSLYLFHRASYPYSKNSPEASLVRRYVRLFQTFASTGNADIQECNGEDFPDNCEYLSIVNDDDEPFQTGTTWNTERMDIWDQIYTTYC